MKPTLLFERINSFVLISRNRKTALATRKTATLLQKDKTIVEQKVTVFNVVGFVECMVIDRFTFCQLLL